MLQVEVQQVSEIKVSWCYDNRRWPGRLARGVSRHGRGTPLHVGAAILCARAKKTAQNENALHSLLPAVLGTIWRRCRVQGKGPPCLSRLSRALLCVCRQVVSQGCKGLAKHSPASLLGPPEEGAVSSCGWKTRQPHFLPGSGKEMGYK